MAEGADMGCIAEAHNYVHEGATGTLAFLFPSCCPAWATLTKKHFPDLAPEVSQELTPMVATARKIKEKDEAARVVFIGPCAAKKLEASRKDLRSFVDFVLTFEELNGMFAARNVDLAACEEDTLNTDASGAGRGYAVAGGVASAIEQCINEYFPETEVKIAHAEGLADCRKTLMLARAGKLNGYMIEGMGCPGGCVAGVGTIIDPVKAKVFVDMQVKGSEEKIPPKELEETAERLTKMH